MTDVSDAIELLLVEDSATDAELCLRALRKQNLANSVVWVKDGAEALDFLFGPDGARSAPKVVLLDLRLPKVDGLEVLRRMKAEPSTRTIPVVVLTSSREDRDIAASYDLGVNSYIGKPVQFEEFARVVSQLGLYWLVVNRPPPAKRTP